jgi:magnesium chelatase subunit I
LIKNLIEQVAFEARESEFVDSKSGVSARLTISALENLVSTAERRILINKENKTTLRISDLSGIIPSITGKVELVYEGEQEGPIKVAHILIGKAVKTQFENYFPSPDKIKRTHEQNPYQEIITWFSKGNEVDILNNCTNDDYKLKLESIPGLKKLVDKLHPNTTDNEKLLMMEFLLHGLSEYSLLSRHKLEYGIQFKDMISSMFAKSDDDDKDDEEFYT